MNHSDREKLLSEIVGGTDVTQLRERSLELGIRALRARKRNRRGLAAGALAAAAILLASISLPGKNPAAVPALSHALPPQEPVREIKVVTDDELLALFPDRPVALVGSPGHKQELIFLDQAPNDRSAL